MAGLQYGPAAVLHSGVAPSMQSPLYMCSLPGILGSKMLLGGAYLARLVPIRTQGAIKAE